MGDFKIVMFWSLGRMDNSHLIINTLNWGQVLDFPHIFFRRTQESSSKALYRMLVSPPSKMKAAVLPQQTQEMNSTEVSRNPGCHITNRLSWRKRTSCHVWFRYLWSETWKWQLFLTLTAACLRICVFRVSWEQVYRQAVAAVAFLMMNLEKKKNKTTPHPCLSLTEWK